MGKFKVFIILSVFSISGLILIYWLNRLNIFGIKEEEEHTKKKSIALRKEEEKGHEENSEINTDIENKPEIITQDDFAPDSIPVLPFVPPTCNTEFPSPRNFNHVMRSETSVEISWEVTIAECKEQQIDFSTLESDIYLRKIFNLDTKQTETYDHLKVGVSRPLSERPNDHVYKFVYLLNDVEVQNEYTFEVELRDRNETSLPGIYTFNVYPPPPVVKSMKEVMLLHPEWFTRL